MSSREGARLAREHKKPNMAFSDRGAAAPAAVSMHHQQSRDSFATHSAYGDDLPAEFLDMDLDEECVLGQATIMDTSEAKKRASIVGPPNLPQKSSLRASRMLESLTLNSIASATQSLHSTHDMYLSSEEDASSSAGDFSEDGYDSTSDEARPSHTRRHSQEDTAKVVSVVFSGKPCIVELPRRSISPTPSGSLQPVGTDRARSSSEPRRSSSEPRPRPSLATRHTSLFTTSMPSGRPSFLSIDPFASGSYSSETPKAEQENGAEDARPKTPTSAVFKGFQRTFSLVKKRSRPVLQNLNMGNATRESLILTTASSSSLDLRAASSADSAAASNKSETSTKSDIRAPRATSALPPVSYNDIVDAANKAAKKNAAMKRASLAPPRSSTFSALPSPQLPASPMSPATTQRGLLSSLKSRRRSMKA